MCPHPDTASDAGNAVSQEQIEPCLDTKPGAHICSSQPAVASEDSDYELSSQASCVEEELPVEESGIGIPYEQEAAVSEP